MEDDDNIEIMFDTDINTVVKMMTVYDDIISNNTLPNPAPTVFVDNKTKSNLIAGMCRWH